MLCRIYLLLVSCVSFHILSVYSLPVDIAPANLLNVRYDPDVFANLSDQLNDTMSQNGPLATLKFLRQFGYLEEKKGNDSESLYSEESVAAAVKQMQKFGDLPQTGQMDRETIQLLSAPRCGVPDVVQKGSRTKRFVIGSKGWNKRKLSYRIENWTQKMYHGNIINDISKAFNVWADYAQLRFSNMSRSGEVDISILFGRGYHNDRFPFDGPGGVLAHAYFPYDYGTLGGDIHFDEDENWISGFERNGDSSESGYNPISFLAVAIHELGHSLGLSHSHIRDSVMFPYYQATTQEPRLAYDDIMAVYQLYIQRELQPTENDGSEEDTPSHEPTSTTTTTKTTTHSNYDEDHSTTRATRVSSTTTLKSIPEFPTIPTTTEKYSGNDLPPPDLCKSQFDTISYIRGEIFVFKGSYMWRLPDKKSFQVRTPFKIARLFSGLEGVKQIDALYERDSDGNIVFFSGQSYWIFEGTTAVEGYPRQITDFGLPSTLQKIDAAFVWEKNQLVYFFSDDLYWRYNETMKSMDEFYPKDISNWGGVPENLNAAMRWKDGTSYFFKEKDFWKFEDSSVHISDGYPQKTGPYWFGCP